MQARTIPVVSSVLAAAVLSVYLVAQPMAKRAQAGNAEDGVVRVRSAYSLTETLDRLKKDVAAKGIMMFSGIDQAKFAVDAGIAPRASTLLVFGNPKLGVQFIASRVEAGLDCPVRSSLDGLQRFPLDRSAPPHQRPRAGLHRWPPASSTRSRRAWRQNRRRRDVHSRSHSGTPLRSPQMAVSYSGTARPVTPTRA